MTKEEFLKNPFCYENHDDIPVEWIAEAWVTNAGSYRRITTEQLARDVSKHGMLEPTGRYVTPILSKALSGEQVVALYQQIRDDSARLEPEWRQEFENAFPTHVHLLPAMDAEGVRIYYEFMRQWDGDG